MKSTKSTKIYTELPDTITPLDYMEWRGCGRATADAVFHQKDFPRVQGTGTKLMADKRAVLLHELGLKEDEKQAVLKEIARQIIQV